MVSWLLKIRSNLETTVIGHKYGSDAKTIAKKYNLQNLLGGKSATNQIKHLYESDREARELVLKKNKETRPPWFVRNITLSAYSANRGYDSTYDDDCIFDMATGTLLYLGGDLKDDFCDHHLEKILREKNEQASYESIVDLMNEDKILKIASTADKESSLKARAMKSLLDLGNIRLKQRNNVAFEEYRKRKDEKLDGIQALDFLFRYLLRTGEIERVRKMIEGPLDKKLETQKKLGYIGVTWAIVNDILTGGGKREVIDGLEMFYLNGTNLTNFAGDDLKEVKEDFAPDERSSVGIENPANVLSLLMISEGYNTLSYALLKDYMKRNLGIVAEMLTSYVKRLYVGYEKLKDTEYSQDILPAMGLMVGVAKSGIRKFEKNLNIELSIDWVKMMK